MRSSVSLKNHYHISPMVDPGSRSYIGGSVVDAGQDFVTVGGVAVAVVGGKVLCVGVQREAAILSGSSMALIAGLGFIAYPKDNSARMQMFKTIFDKGVIVLLIKVLRIICLRVMKLPVQ